MGHNPNFVSELVQMAKAFEELPIVQGQLAESRQQVTEKDITIHELELKLIDLTNALDAANSATHKAEVERDHAESMFLESDDKLARAKDVFRTFIDDANDYLRAVEPQAQPEPVAEPVVEPITQPEPRAEIEVVPMQPVVSVPANPTPLTTDGGAGTLGQSEAGPIADTQPSPALPDNSSQIVNVEQSVSTPTEEAPHPVDPTASSVAGAGALPETATPTLSVESGADASTASTPEPIDNVGYHNEPTINHAQPDAWSAWDAWCSRMNARYGSGQWPARTQAAQ